MCRTVSPRLTSLTMSSSRMSSGTTMDPCSPLAARTSSCASSTRVPARSPPPSRPTTVPRPASSPTLASTAPSARSVSPARASASSRSGTRVTSPPLFTPWILTRPLESSCPSSMRAATCSTWVVRVTVTSVTTRSSTTSPGHSASRPTVPPPHAVVLLLCPSVVSTLRRLSSPACTSSPRTLSSPSPSSARVSRSSSRKTSTRTASPASLPCLPTNSSPARTRTPFSCPWTRPSVPILTSPTWLPSLTSSTSKRAPSSFRTRLTTSRLTSISSPPPSSRLVSRSLSRKC
mmetsp:Transcript_12041/g.23556  ORF Transcript_12041/g.23556 Transcript_12041/m.23556 type:complete len:290 (-) Transcript_12041:184-1053(-)